jgi:hypothetical protein
MKAEMAYGKPGRGRGGRGKLGRRRGLWDLRGDRRISMGKRRLRNVEQDVIR